jgi:hypothetical protein
MDIAMSPPNITKGITLWLDSHQNLNKGSFQPTRLKLSFEFNNQQPEENSGWIGGITASKTTPVYSISIVADNSTICDG